VKIKFIEWPVLYYLLYNSNKNNLVIKVFNSLNISYLRRPANILPALILLSIYGIIFLSSLNSSITFELPLGVINMTDISTVKSNLHKEVEYKRHIDEMRKLRETNKKVYTKENKIYQKKMSDIKSSFTQNKELLENSLQKQLISLRKKHQYFLKDERNRLKTEIDFLQKTHGEKMIELTESHHEQIDNKQSEHKQSLTVAESTFNREVAKYDI